MLFRVRGLAAQWLWCGSRDEKVEGLTLTHCAVAVNSHARVSVSVQQNILMSANWRWRSAGGKVTAGLVVYPASALNA